MIMISSSAGVRMAKAYAAVQKEVQAMNGSPSMNNGIRAARAMKLFTAAAQEVGEELMEQNLHEMTGP